MVYHPTPTHKAKAERFPKERRKGEVPEGMSIICFFFIYSFIRLSDYHGCFVSVTHYR